MTEKVNALLFRDNLGHPESRGGVRSVRLLCGFEK